MTGDNLRDTVNTNPARLKTLFMKPLFSCDLAGLQITVQGFSFWWLMISRRFWSKVNVGSVDECWEWTAATKGRRKCFYGNFFDGKRMVSAHRHVMSSIHTAEGIEGKCVLHSCDNPLCVNPRHLRLGTHQDNMNDMVLRSGKNVSSRARQIRRSSEFNDDIDGMIKKAQELIDKGCSHEYISVATGLDASLFG